MPSVKNPSIGKCPCSMKDCSELADVRQEKGHERGAMYLDCPEHGRIAVNGAKFKARNQAWIEKNRIPESTEPAPDAIPEQAPENPEPKPEPEKAQATESPEEVPEVSGIKTSIAQGAQELDEWLK